MQQTGSLRYDFVTGRAPRVRLKVSVRRGASPQFFRGEGMEVAEKGAGLTPAPSVPDTFNRTQAPHGQ
jgi:hypothetical protein